MSPIPASLDAQARIAPSPRKRRRMYPSPSQERFPGNYYNYRNPTPDSSVIDEDGSHAGNDRNNYQEGLDAWDSEDSCGNYENSHIVVELLANGLAEELVRVPQSEEPVPQCRRARDDQHRPGQSSTRHFGCPFYFSDPATYRHCLLHHELRSAHDVKKHVQTHHMKPLYCPLCYDEFPTISDRNGHISTRSCIRRERREVDGIDDYQRAKLSRSDDPCLSERVRWNIIWETVFPHTEPPRSPYLEEGCGLAVPMARDYWR